MRAWVPHGACSIHCCVQCRHLRRNVAVHTVRFVHLNFAHVVPQTYVLVRISKASAAYALPQIMS